MTIRTAILFLFSMLVLVACGSSGSITPSNSDAELIRTLENERLSALVEADMQVANRLHADEFQLIDPYGHAYTKAEYLGGIASGEEDYLIFEPESEIKVRIHGKSAVLRYRSVIEIVVGDQHYSPEKFWHTDTYEYRDGLWQAVWSQATKIVD